jgi:LacI family transcriptional regulator
LSVTKKRTERATIANVAKAAGVSTATAGRVLGGYGYSSEEIRTRVQEAARVLAYRPNRLARGLITGQTQTIGVVAADIGSPYYASAMRGIADVARTAGFGAIITNSDESLKLEQEAVELLLEKQVDGIIVSPADPENNKHLDAALAAGCPVVQLDRVAYPLQADSVTVDNRGAAKDCVGLLLRTGHTRIAIVAELETSPFGSLSQFMDTAQKVRLDPQTLYPSWQRLLGYLEAHWEAGVPVRQELIGRAGSYAAESARSCVQQLMGAVSPPSAIFAADGVMATGTVQALNALQMRIPHDISLVCFDDLDWMAFYGPGITTVAQPVRQLGAMAAAFLLERIGGESPPVRHTVVGAQLIERGSVVDRLGAATD